MNRNYKNSEEAFLAAFAERGYEPADMIPVVSEKAPEWFKKRAIADAKLTVIADGINAGRIPKPGERMYFPIFFKDSSNNNAGFGLTATHYDYWFSITTVGERHEFFSREDALYFGSEIFVQLHKDHKIIDKTNPNV